MCDGDTILKQLDDLSKKIDAVPAVVKEEIENGMILCGIDPKDPIAVQELVSWGRHAMEREKKTSSRVRNLVTDLIFKGIVFLIMLGFVTFYTQNLVKYAIREDKNKTEVVTKEVENGKR